MVCRNICLRLYANTQASGHYSAGGKYCRRCECYLITSELFCECCGMQPRATPTEKELKERQNMKKDRKRKLVSKSS